MILYSSTSLPSNWNLASMNPFPGVSHICLHLEAHEFYMRSLEDLEEELAHNFRLEYSELLSSTATKYLIRLDDPFFHVIYDALTLVLKIHRLDPAAVFILYRPRIESESTRKIYEYFEELFKSKNIEYLMLYPARDELIDKMGYYSPVIETSNYIDIVGHINDNDLRFTLDDYLLMSREVMANIGGDGVAPHRKVYLSRSHIEHRQFETKEGHVGHTDDTRMYDEELLEDFFRSKGYEIVIPEQRFSTFREQLEYMRSVKVMASITSSAITNALFMEDSQVVIEIVAELVFPTEDRTTEQTLFGNYIQTSYEKLHTHVCVPSRRDPRPVIKAIETLVNSLHP